MKRICFVLPALLAVAACDNGTQSADITAEEAAVDGDLAANSSVAPAPSPPTDAGTPAPTEIPAVLRGRWGLVPADCTSTRGDAKGLLTIGDDKLQFYESVGTLDTIMEAEPTRIRASFDFEGEGMTWEREIVLDLQDDGTTLIRREYGEDAAPGPLRYAKCNQGRMP
ncbi:MAG TPA: hypothetical protein VI168_13245 [Croceibacterium sp.]